MHPRLQRLPHNPLGRTPHPKEPSLATNDSLDSGGWLAAGKGWARMGGAINPPSTVAGGQRGPAHCSFPYRFSRSAPEAKETSPQAIHYRLVQEERASAGTAQLRALAPPSVPPPPPQSSISIRFRASLSLLHHDRLDWMSLGPPNSECKN